MELQPKALVVHAHAFAQLNIMNSNLKKELVFRAHIKGVFLYHQVNVEPDISELGMRLDEMQLKYTPQARSRGHREEPRCKNPSPASVPMQEFAHRESYPCTVPPMGVTMAVI